MLQVISETSIAKEVGRIIINMGMVTPPYRLHDRVDYESMAHIVSVNEGPEVAIDRATIERCLSMPFDQARAILMTEAILPQLFPHGM